MENNSKICFNGSKWITNNCGTIEIVGKSTKRNYYFCKFEDETIVESYIECIKNGKVKNPNFPSILGIGFIGIGNHLTKINNKTTKEYSMWRNMLERCYSTKIQIKNSSYIGCVVDSRWHNFQNFCEDIKYLDGYFEWKNNEEIKYELDKDIKIKGNKIYSKNNCIFITAFKNNSNAHITGDIYIATRIFDNYEEEFTNQSEFARKHNLNQGCVNKCIKGSYKQTKGWTFKEKF